MAELVFVADAKVVAANVMTSVVAALDRGSVGIPRNANSAHWTRDSDHCCPFSQAVVEALYVITLTPPLKPLPARWPLALSSRRIAPFGLPPAARCAIQRHQRNHLLKKTEKDFP